LGNGSSGKATALPLCSTLAAQQSGCTAEHPCMVPPGKQACR
jgi:hypothetical protein